MELDLEELMILRAARETGMIDALMTDAHTPAEVADSTAVSERSARIVVDALVDMGFLTELQSRYEPTDRSLGFLATRDIRSIGSVPHRLDCLENWIALPETLCGEDPPLAVEDRIRHFQGAMATVDESTVRAFVTEAIHSHPHPDRVLDVGGGPGRFSKEFVRRGFAVTMFDRPGTIETVEPLLNGTRVELVSGDALESLPRGFDLVFCSRLAHGFDRDENRRLLANVADALEPGGTVVHVDYVRDRSDRASTFGAKMLAQTPGGNTYTGDEFETWLTDAGLEDVEIRDVPGTPYQSIVGHRPE